MAANNSRQKFIEAMRDVIHHQIIRRKKKLRFVKFCPECKTHLTAENCEGDHVIPFKDVLVAFCGEEPWGWLSMVKYEWKSNGRGWTIHRDHYELIKQWDEFHELTAQIKLICKDCHDKKDNQQRCG